MLNIFLERAEKIKNDKKLPEQMRDVLLADVMDTMETMYRIPMIRNPEWEAEHKEIIDAYRKISNMRSM